MEDRIFLLVKCTVKTKYRHIHEAIAEFQSETKLQLTSTPNVEVLKAEIIKMNTKTLKK
jgi:hypothetical protein